MTKRNDKVVVAMSGGVDSSVAALQLIKQGYDVTALFMHIGVEMPPDPQNPDNTCPHESDDARAMADRLNIPFVVAEFKTEFEPILDYFADEYLLGRTPNPCVLCNRTIKFGRLLDYARSLGARYFATGHYARITRDDTICRLRKALYRPKDQSYVLYGLDREILPNLLFPNGELTKQQVRQLAEQFGLHVADKPDSQDICFAPDGNYARLVRQRRPEAFREGPILDQTGRELGRHAGLAHFTIGQRRGLGVAMGIPYYVTAIDRNRNAVIIGPADELLADELIAANPRWLVDPPAAPCRATVKIRYAHPGAPATIEPLENNRLHVRFDQPQRAITPGQSAVFYDDDIVLGGDIIETAPQ